MSGRAGQVGLVLAVVCACTDFKASTDTLFLSPSGAGASSEVLASNPPEEPSSEWGCLDTSVRPAPLPVYAEAVARVVYRVQVVDLSTGQIYPDARVRACGIADINCENPVTGFLPVDAEGWVDIPLFRGFIGFLEINSSDAVPYVFYLTEPLVESAVEYPIGFISLKSLGPLVQLLGVQPVPDTGVVTVRAFDCLGNTASNVTVATDAVGVPWYFVDGLPNGTVSETAEDGLGGLVNVQPGVVVFDAVAPTGVSIRGPQSVVVRPNWMSVAYLRPRAGLRAPPL